MSNYQVNIVAAYFPLDLAKQIARAATIKPKIIKDDSGSTTTYVLTAWGQIFSLKEIDNGIDVKPYLLGPVQDLIIDLLNDMYVTTLTGTGFFIAKLGTHGTIVIKDVVATGDNYRGFTVITNDGIVQLYDIDHKRLVTLNTPEPIVAQSEVSFTTTLLLGLSGRVWYYNNEMDILKDTDVTDATAISSRALLLVDGRVYEILERSELDIKFRLNDVSVDGIAINSIENSSNVSVYLITRSRDILEKSTTMNEYASLGNIKYRKMSIGGSALSVGLRNLTIGSIIPTIIRTDGRVLVDMATVPRLNVFH